MPDFKDKNPNGILLYEGPSTYDGAPLVVIATGFDEDSRNEKTGAMIQTWILRADVAPNEAVKTGDDQSMCGKCPHRPLLSKENGMARCYVQVFRAPLNVWKCYKRDGYRRGTARDLAGRPVRIGSYGNPSAVPTRVWDEITLAASTWTAYEHKKRGPLRYFAMASVDSMDEAKKLQEKGVRTFRVGPANDLTHLPTEILCPASKEAGYKTTCVKCGLCNGTQQGDMRMSIFIPAHGSGSGQVRDALPPLNGPRMPIIQ